MSRWFCVLCFTATIVAAAGWTAPAGHAQVREFDFYGEFREWRMALPPQTRNQVDEVLRLYRDKLTKDGVAAAEIDRRVTIVRTRRNELEADFWNRFFTAPNPGFNTEPNAFLVSVVEKRKPGRALDIGMGEGRNALYLAKLGWDVTGFDPAEKAVALADERAKKLGVKLTTKVALDTDFDFGAEQWDLILYSWVSPFASARKAVAALKPGGIVVLESGSMLFPRKDVLPELFAPLRVVQNSEVRAASDFFERREMDILRFVAEKPRQ
jgi:SAM-dependent methyltransferase